MKKNLFLVSLATVLVIGCADSTGDYAYNDGDVNQPTPTPGATIPGQNGSQTEVGGNSGNQGSGDGTQQDGGQNSGGTGQNPSNPNDPPVDDPDNQGGKKQDGSQGDDTGDGGVPSGDNPDDCCVGITGVEKGTCVNNVCEVEYCVAGYHINTKGGCSKDTKTACGADAVNCNDLIDTAGYEHAGVMSCSAGECKIKSCMDGYQLKEGKCEGEADFGGGVNCPSGWITVSTYEMGSKPSDSICYQILENEEDIANVDALTPNLPVENSKYKQYYCIKGALPDRYCRHIPNEYNPDSMLVVHPGQYCTPEQANPGSDTLRVHMMDIGQGDSIWIQTPTGQNVLIDGGDGGAFGKTSAGPIVTDYLNSHGFPYGSTFDLVILTHPHSDHFGGFNNIFNTNNKKTHYKLANYLDPMDYTQSASASYDLPSTYTQWVNRVKGFLPESKGKKNAHVYMPAEDYFKAGQAFPAEFFGSEVQTQYISSRNTFKGDDANPASIIFKLSYKGVNFLFTGDAEKEQEKDAIATGIDLSSHFLKVCHHGSSTSSSTQFLDAIWKKISESSRFALISSGRKTYSGSFIPTSEVLERLKTYLSEDHIYSTSVGDDNKIETESYRDDNILVVVKPDGSYYACYNGTN